MPMEAISIWSEFGLAGMVIFALFGFIWFLVKTHSSERKEWLEAYRDHGRRSDERQAETNDVIREISAVIRVLSAKDCRQNK